MIFFWSRYFLHRFYCVIIIQQKALYQKISGELMKIYKGTIISADAKNGIYSYLVEENGKIIFVGNDLPSQYSGAEVIELGEGALMPTFADTLHTLLRMRCLQRR